MLNFNQNSHNPLKTLVILILHVFLLAFVVYSLLMLLSVILPMAFEWLYTLSTQLFSLMVPVSILISSLLVILLPNPIYSLIALILVFLNTAIFLLSIKVQFLALIYLIVYIGAIAILFLFVIMLFNLRSLQKSDLKIKDFSFLTISFKFYFFFGVKFFLILALEIWNLVEYSTYFNKEAVYHQFDLQYFLTYVHWDILLFSNLFYTYYSYIFLLSGLVLLAAMIGSIVLALSTTENLPSSFSENQNVSVKKSNTLIDIRHNGLSFFTRENIVLNWNRFKIFCEIYNIDWYDPYVVIQPLQQPGDIIPQILFVSWHIDELEQRPELEIIIRLQKIAPNLFLPLERGKCFMPNECEAALEILSKCNTDYIWGPRMFDSLNGRVKWYYCARQRNADGSYTYGSWHLYEDISCKDVPYLELSPKNRRKAGWPANKCNSWIDPHIRKWKVLEPEIRNKWTPY